MKLPYEAGTWFAIALRCGGYAVGNVARTPKQGKVLLGYFFGPRREVVPSLGELSSQRATDAIRVLRFGDLALIKGQWPIIGRSSGWTPQDWPMPSFVRKDGLSGKSWEVSYKDEDPSEVVAEELLVRDSDDMERDGVFGAVAVELLLSQILCSPETS